MKNIVYLIIDSLNYSHVKKNPHLMPFFSTLKKESLCFEKMYSEAPYTEAAVMNIYCGQNVLDSGGYLKRFKNVEKTVFESMKEKGFCTFYNSLQPQCFPSSLKRGIDYLFYNVGFDLEPLWSYRLYHYSKLFSNNQLTDLDYTDLIEIFDDNFDEWLSFIRGLIDGISELELISSNSNSFNAKEVLKMVEEQFNNYQMNKIGFINEVLKKKTKHPIFLIPSFKQNFKVKDKSFMEMVHNKYLHFFKDIDRKNRCLNKKNCKGVLRGPVHKMLSFLKHPSGSSLKEFGKSIMIFKNVYHDSDLFDRIATNYDTFKNAPSIKTHIDHYISWEKNRDHSKPSFACIHVDDIHNPEVFFTYDSADISLIDEEMKDAKDVFDNLPDNYYGNITHDLSLRYIDSKIKYLFNQLKNNELIKDTVVLICADHGFSFSGNPLRDSFVINMYLENYNIPCIVWGSDLKGTCDDFCSSKDIPLLLSSIPEHDGKSIHDVSVILNKMKRQDCFIEYCGGGCPDLKRRKLKIGCFNDKWFVATESFLDKKLQINDIVELYNMKEDPLQLNNLAKKQKEFSEYQSLLDSINHRKETILSEIIFSKINK